MVKPKRVPTCGHQDRKHKANGLCKACYKATPEYKAKERAAWRARYATPEYKAKDRARRAARYATPEYKAKNRARQAARLVTAQGRAKSVVLASVRRARARGYAPILWSWQRLAAWLATKGDTCEGCGQKCPTGNRLCIDHNHKTGDVRALLCGPCNTRMAALDAFADDPDRARRLFTLSGH